MMGQTPSSTDRHTDLYKTYAPFIYRRSRRMLGNEQDALDAVHDVFLRLQECSDSFRGEADITTWLYRVTTNHCLNRLRGQRNWMRFIARWEAQSQQRRFVPPNDAVEHRDFLRQLLQKHKSRRVQIAYHYFCDEMTQNEIAQLIGISERAVRKTIQVFLAHSATSK